MSNAILYISVWCITSLVLGVALGTAIDRMGGRND